MSRPTAPLLVLATLAACGSAPEPAPLVPPPLETGARYLPGTVLTGTRPGPSDIGDVSFGDALDVRCSVTFVERMPWQALDALPARTRLIVAARGADPLLPASEFAVGARVGSGDEAERFLAAVEDGSAAGRSVPVLELRGAVPPGATVAFYARSIDAVVADDGAVVRKLVTMLVGREDDGKEASIALVFEDVAPERPLDPDDELPPPTVRKREIVLLEDVPRIDGPPLAVVIPSPFDAAATRAFVVDVAFRSPILDDPGFENAVEHCVADLRTAGEQATAAAAWLGDAEREARSIAAGLRALDLARNHRPTLAFLAGQSPDAQLALDLALSADEATLAAWAQLVDEAAAGVLEAADAAAAARLGWVLERTAFELLATRLDRDDLSIELRGTLARHAGEAGRFPGMLTGMLSRAPDRASFVAMLGDENLGFLEAPDPSSRVRAFDWLHARGAAPEGYDPLADRDARRDALDAFREARAEAAR